MEDCRAPAADLEHTLIDIITAEARNSRIRPARSTEHREQARRHRPTASRTRAGRCCAGGSPRWTVAETATKQRSRQRRTRPPPAPPQRKAVAAVDLLDNERGPGSKDPGHPNSHDANRSESNGNTDCNHSVAPEPDQPRFRVSSSVATSGGPEPGVSPLRLAGGRRPGDRPPVGTPSPVSSSNSQSSVASSGPGSRSSLPARSP